MRIIKKEHTEICVIDEPGQGNACHEYEIQDQKCGTIYSSVRFQNGPIKEFGINGCTQEDLLEIVVDRLESFQSGDFRCRENAIALTKIQEAIHWLNHRTPDRKKRKVEGTNQQ